MARSAIYLRTYTSWLGKNLELTTIVDRCCWPKKKADKIAKKYAHSIVVKIGNSYDKIRSL